MGSPANARELRLPEYNVFILRVDPASVSTEMSYKVPIEGKGDRIKRMGICVNRPHRIMPVLNNHSQQPVPLSWPRRTRLHGGTLKRLLYTHDLLYELLEPI